MAFILYPEKPSDKRPENFQTALKLDLHVLCFFLRDLEHGSVRVAERIGQDHVGKLLDADVVNVDAFVEKFTPVRDLVLKP